MWPAYSGEPFSEGKVSSLHSVPIFLLFGLLHQTGPRDQGQS
jgi:hypothetical protein